jgi:hypothetical protein
LGTGRVPFGSLTALLRAVPVSPEDPGTAALMERLRAVRRAGEFDRAAFLAMCRWKSPRALLHYRRHSAATVRRVARAVLATRSERRRLALLTALRGVSVPTASAILTLIEPRRYAVLDIRVWQLLHALGAVEACPAGRGFGATHWEQFLRLLRAQARALGITPRLVELTLFHYHRTVQTGRLYEPARPAGRRRNPIPVRAAPPRKSGRPSHTR